MRKQFEGKVAIVTGGGQGIGGAVVNRLASEGAAVVVADVRPLSASAAEQFRLAGGKVTYIRTDVTRAADTQAMVEMAQREFGGLDILVNCAGIFPRATLMETTDELWDRVISVNLKGVFHACQAAVPVLISRGGGVIINIGSLHAAGGSPNLVAYAASKGGVVTLTRNLARALAGHRIRVNCVHPGWVSSEGEIELQKTQQQSDDWMDNAKQAVPFGRMQTPDEVAASVQFLASDQAEQVTGQILAVDGGLGFKL